MVGHRVLKFKLILGGHDSRVTSSVDVITQEGGGDKAYLKAFSHGITMFSNT